MSVLMHGIGMTSQRTRERLLKRLREKGISNEQVLDVMRVVPRHLFVDEALASRAYDDTALPIGYGQTISQPWVVARMTEALIEHGRPETVLEIGTGSGYQAAVLGCLVKHVYTLERIRALAILARERMRRFGLKNVHVRHADGFRGWAAHGPFQAILLTAAPEGVPDELFDQLTEGGRLIAPVGSRDVQDLTRFTRRGDRLEREVLDRVVFVPMLGGTQ